MCDLSHNNKKKRDYPFSIEVYTKTNGESPFRTFLLNLPTKMKAKVLWTIELLKETGINLREPYSAPLNDGLFELRIKFGSDITRCLYFFYKGQIVILTNGFTKKSQKTPYGEIRKAKLYRADWIRRNT